MCCLQKRKYTAKECRNSALKCKLINFATQNQPINLIMKKSILIAATGFVLFACQSTPKADKTTANITISLNKEFSIDLASNPTTGYSWKWVNVVNSKVVKTDDSYKPAGRGNLAGGGGTQTLKFRGIKRGFETIKLHYVRPWEKGAPPAQTATYTIEIR